MSEASTAARARARGVVAMGLGAIFVGALLQPFSVSLFAGSEFVAPAERRDLLRILSIAPLLLGALLLLLRHPIAARLVPISAGAITLAVCALVFLGGDLLLSYRGLERPTNVIAPRSIYDYPPRLGWAPRPGDRDHRELPGNYSVDYNIDSDGYRVVPGRREFDPRTMRRLVFFGDSYTFGHGVDDADAYPAVISRSLVRPHIYVVNAGVSGYGLIQMVTRFEDALAQLRAGDIVVFAPTSRDLTRNLVDPVRMSREAFRRPDGWFPVYRDGRIEAVAYGTATNRLLATFFYAPVSGDFSRFVYRGLTASKHRSIQEAHALLRLVRGACEAKGLTFRFFFLPELAEVRKNRYRVDVSSFDFPDLRAFFPEDEAALDGLRYRDDAHWRPEGHRVAARAIVTELAASGALETADLRDDPVR